MTSAGEFSPSASSALGEPALDEDGVRLDAGLLGEGVEERLDQAGLAGRVDVDLAALGEGGGGDDGEERGGKARPQKPLKLKCIEVPPVERVQGPDVERQALLS